MKEIKIQVLDKDGIPIGEENWYMSTGWTHIVYAEPVSEDGSHWVHGGVFPDESLVRNIRQMKTDYEAVVKEILNTNVHGGEIFIEWVKKLVDKYTVFREG